MNKKNLIGIIIAVLLIATGIIVNNAGKTEDKIIVFGDLSWDSAQIHNRIAAFIIENGFDGYSAEYTPGGTIPIVQGVIKGDIDVNMESWHSNFTDVYEKGIESGDLIDLGKNLPDAPQGWYVPRYVIEGDNAQAPDLRSVQDLKKYAKLFPDPEDSSQGVVYGGASGWGQLAISQEIFEKYGLEETFNFTVPGSGAALKAPLVAAYEKKEPWVGYYWEPSAILGKLDMVRLEGSEYAPADVNILVSKKLKETAPEVIELLENYSTTVAQNNAILAEKEDKKLSIEEAAIWFLRNYDNVWTKWVDSKTTQRVKKALK